MFRVPWSSLGSENGLTSRNLTWSEASDELIRVSRCGCVAVWLCGGVAMWCCGVIGTCYEFAFRTQTYAVINIMTCEGYDWPFCRISHWFSFAHNCTAIIPNHHYLIDTNKSHLKSFMTENLMSHYSISTFINCSIERTTFCCSKLTVKQL